MPIDMLLNIGSNALKFTKPGGNVTIKGMLDDEHRIVLEIADSGIGMTEDEVRLALQPFGQVQSAFTRKDQGTGLGLPIAQSFVELHGGTLEINSRKGRGTLVRVVFPAERTVDPARGMFREAMGLLRHGDSRSHEGGKG